MLGERRSGDTLFGLAEVVAIRRGLGSAPVFGFTDVAGCTTPGVVAWDLPRATGRGSPAGAMLCDCVGPVLADRCSDGCHGARFS